jgi:DNA recombination protein RmuC
MSLVTSIKAHYQSLAVKDYAQIVGKGLSVPFTVMFVPIEAAGIEAFRAAPDLFNDAQKRKVIIVTPTTLFCVLQLVSALWSIHDKQANALEIADQGRLMLKKLGTFLDSFAAVGKSLQNAVATYETAKGQLQDGRGNLMSLAGRWVKLGVEAPSSGELPKLIAIAGERQEVAEGPQEENAAVSLSAEPV